MAAQLLALAAGLWLMAAPDLLGYDGPARVLDRVIGPVVATLAAVAMAECTRSVRWWNLPLAVSLLAAPWILGYPPAAAADSVASGLLIGLTTFVRGRIRHATGGGWAALGRRP